MLPPCPVFSRQHDSTHLATLLTPSMMASNVRHVGRTRMLIITESRMHTAVEVPELLTIQEAAEILRVARSTVYALIAAGELPRVKIRRSVRIRREDVERIAREGTGNDA